MTTKTGTGSTSSRDVDTAILGAGLAGLGASYHLGHPNSVIFEAKAHYGGHLFSWQRNGFTWDDGPHISFTMNPVKDLLAECVNGEYEEVEIKATNYFKGHWIDHPAQTSLWQIPEPCERNAWEFYRNGPKGTREAKELRGMAPSIDGAGVRRHVSGGVHAVHWTCEPGIWTSIGSASVS